MTTTNTMLEVFLEILKRFPDLGYAATADAIGTTYIDHDAKFGNSRLGTDEYADLYIYRYNLTGDDRVKMSGDVTVSSGQLAHTSVDNYSDTSDKSYMLLGIHPDIIIDAIIRGWARISTRSHRALTTIDDFDCETSGVAYWNGVTDGAVSNCTPTKVTTAGNVFSGTQSVLLTYSGAGYNRSATFRVQPGQQLYIAARTRLSAGTLTFNLWDKTNSAVYGATAPTYSGRDFGVVWRKETVPSGCYEMQAQFNGASSADRIYIDTGFGPYVKGRRRYLLPTWMDQTWRVKLFRQTKHSTIASQVFDAWSREWVGDYIPPKSGDSGDFSLEMNRRDANPYSVTFYEDFPDCPIEMAVERLISDTETFAAPSDTTIVDFVQLCDYAIEELADVMTTQYAKGDPGWAEIKNRYQLTNAVHVIARPIQSRVEPGSRTQIVMNA